MLCQVKKKRDLFFLKNGEGEIFGGRKKECFNRITEQAVLFFRK
jgi:hypothetical protein